MLNCNNYL